MMSPPLCQSNTDMLMSLLSDDVHVPGGSRSRLLNGVGDGRCTRSPGTVAVGGINHRGAGSQTSRLSRFSTGSSVDSTGGVCSSETPSTNSTIPAQAKPALHVTEFGNNSVVGAPYSATTTTDKYSLNRHPMGDGQVGAGAAGVVTAETSSKPQETALRTPPNGTNGSVVDTREVSPPSTAEVTPVSHDSSAMVAPVLPAMLSHGGGCDSNGAGVGGRPTRESVLRRLSEALLRRTLTKIDMSQRYLQPSDAKLIRLAMLQNSHLHTLQLGYNNLGDEGVVTLSRALGPNVETGCGCKIRSLDLGFNSIGDTGMKAIAAAYVGNTHFHETNSSEEVSEVFSSPCSMPPLQDAPPTQETIPHTPFSYASHCSLRTLYLAGNCIGPSGAVALAEMIQNGHCRLSKLHLTGNKIGEDGILAITKAIATAERKHKSLTPAIVDAAPTSQADPHIVEDGIRELFLGGTGMGSKGCQAVSEMLTDTPTLRVLSLADNGLTDADCTVLAAAIARNRQSLPLEAVQLSFNQLTCVGVEALMNALWNSKSLRELRLDNNRIGDRGAQLVAVVMENVKTLQRLDVGFNSFTVTGIRAMMKSASETDNVTSLSISGNKLDATSAKAVAYALAYNRSLRYFFMDNCCVNHASQRHITAGIVSNSGVCLHTLTGFRIGAVAVTLGLPPALEQWTNEQVLKFIHLMWERMRQEQEVARQTDPLNFLPPVTPENQMGGRNASGKTLRKPLDPATVVAVANRAFQSLGGNGNGVDGANHILRFRSNWLEHEHHDPSLDCPLVEDIIMEDASEEGSGSHGASLAGAGSKRRDSMVDGNILCENGTSGARNDVVVPMHPQSNDYGSRDQSLFPRTSRVVDPSRKRRNVDWLCHHIRHLHELSKFPFNSAELWRLHQYFYSPNIQNSSNTLEAVTGSENECPSTTSFDSNGHSMVESEESLRVRPYSTTSEPAPSGVLSSAVSNDLAPPFSDLGLDRSCPGRRSVMGTRTRPTATAALERKVSYRSLSDAFSPSNGQQDRLKGRGRTISHITSSDGMSSGNLQRSSKRARRNKTKISYFPRVKKKIDSTLERCHRTSLLLLRQLWYVEKAFLKTFVPQGEPDPCGYMDKASAQDIEAILLDMM